MDNKKRHGTWVVKVLQVQLVQLYRLQEHGAPGTVEPISQLYGMLDVTAKATEDTYVSAAQAIGKATQAVPLQCLLHPCPKPQTRSPKPIFS